EHAEPAAAMSGIDEHIAQPGKGGVVSYEPGEAHLRPLGRVEAKDERVLDGAGHGVARPALGPVTLAADPGVHPGQVDQRPLVARPVASRPRPPHERSLRPAAGMTGSPAGDPPLMRPRPAPLPP